MTWWLWTLVGIGAVVIELGATRDFSLFCVGLSALIVAALAGLNLVTGTEAQWVSFSILAVVLVLVLRTPLQRLISPRDSPVREMDYLIGETALPIDDLPIDGFGKAELRGTQWTARNAAGCTLSKGQRCRVTKVDGLTIWVTAE